MLEAIKCDVCNLECKNTFWGNPEGIEDELFNKENSEIATQLKIENYWGLRSAGLMSYEYDICPKCFIEKIIPFVEELTDKPRKLREEVYSE
jgi:hypothetical protein